MSYDPRFAEGHPVLRPSRIWSPEVIEDIQAKAELGRYRIQGFSTHRRVPGFDDLTFVPCTLSRVPLEGYREKCETRTVLGTRLRRAPGDARPARSPSPACRYGALSRHAKQALGRAAKRAGISTTTGDGGMCPEEREEVDTMVYQVLPSRYGFNPRPPEAGAGDRGRVGQGAKPGTGGMLLGGRCPPRSRTSARCRWASTSGARSGTPTSSGRTTCSSRSRSCARRPSGRSRST